MREYKLCPVIRLSMEKPTRQAIPLDANTVGLLFAIVILGALYWFFWAIKRIERALAEIEAKLEIQSPKLVGSQPQGNVPMQTSSSPAPSSMQPQSNYCVHCGQELGPADAYCPRCGQKRT